VEFTEEQLNAGKSIINPILYGSTTGANQAGISFGKQREISGRYADGSVRL
jgi:hypothetical protein